ncbi:MAG TPA: hypothetical protein VLK66_05565 [Longimicrobium sp.]|nr:hypothetical protein [Longimicrobium sp.]HSU13547.1 hypothetical protein [Longimicrobium sp.]
MSEISARASRRAFEAGSDAPNGDGARGAAGVSARTGAGVGAGAATGAGVGVGTDAGAATGAGAGWGAEAGAATGAGAGVATDALPSAAGAETSNTARQMEQRARTPPAGTLAGSTRKTVLQLVH